MSVMHGSEDMVVPGNALAVQADKPFRGLQKFGVDFLNKFQGSVCNAPILEDISFIDTPGVLSGEKQRIGRSYDFVSVCEWFAERSDLILLLFDAHKLDVSDEFKSVIESLKPNIDKVRIVLNKADMVNGQQLMRVYGALMWSLGKVLQTPEVVRVYLGSFWDKPLQNEDHAKLFEAEQGDLLKELYSLPRYAALRRVNELVKRARLAKVHAYIVSHLKKEMPALFGKDKRKQELLDSLKQVFFELHKRYNLPVGDFPNIPKFRETVKHYDFDKFAKLNQKMIEQMDSVLAEDIPKLMKQFPQESGKIGASTNPFDIEEGSNNPFGDDNDLGDPIGRALRSEFAQQFATLSPTGAPLSGGKAREILLASGLARETLKKLWDLADRDKDGQLSQEEFAICMWLLRLAGEGGQLPDALPAQLALPVAAKGPPAAPSSPQPMGAGLS